MTTTVKALGGGAQPASIDTSGKVTGGPALRVYGFDSEADAQTAGYVCEGGPAMSVALITDAQIASGEWKAQGDPAALVIYTAPDNMPVEGGYSVPVYPVNGWGSAPVPSGPVALLDLEADTGVTTSVTPFQGSGLIVQSGTTVTGTGARFISEVSVGDVISSASINGTVQSITAEGTLDLDTSATVETHTTYIVTPQTVSPRITKWADQSGNGYDFTQTGSARPTLKTIGGVLGVSLDGGDDLLLGQNWTEFNNLQNYTVIAVVGIPAGGLGGGDVLTKLHDYSTAAGWSLASWGQEAYLSDDGSNNWIMQFAVPSVSNTKIIGIMDVPDFTASNIKLYVNGVDLTGDLSSSNPPISNTTTTEPLRIGITGTDTPIFSVMVLYAIRVYAPALTSSQRAAVEAELAARYGVTLP